MSKKTSLPVRLMRKLVTNYFYSRAGAWGGGGWFSISAKLTNPKRVTLGKKPVIHARVWLASIDGPNGLGRISIGDDIHISREVIIASAFHIVIGNGVTIGPRACIYDNNHNSDNSGCSVMKQGISGHPVRIGDYSWIGAHAIILPGVVIGKGAIVGAGSVVTKDVPDNAIIVGNPAIIVKFRDGKAS